MNRILYGTPHFIGGAAPLSAGCGGGDGLLCGRATGCAAGMRAGAGAKSLAESTWAEIAAVSAAGEAAGRWSVGDEKDITLTTGETLTLQIYGFDHDDLGGGAGKAGITFGMKNLMAATRVMHSATSNTGAFTSMTFYTWITGTFIPSLPADLQAVLKTVAKKSSAGNKSTSISTNQVRVFLFAEIEVLGSVNLSVAGEGKVYPIFTDDASRVKSLANGTGDLGSWWGRSPALSSTFRFAAFTNVGDVTSITTTYASGVCLGFCV